MLDENLPAFFYKPSADGVKHHKTVFLTYQGSEPEPAYTLQHADPAVETSRNCYAAALFDSYNPEVLFGETLVKPGWTQPTLSQEEIRRNGGVPPPPAPILPTEFTIQLYNPDQQVTVTQKSGSWGGSSSYEFSMPQTTFRTPSASTLDRTQHDPAAVATTPKLNFVWKRESKLSKDLTCYMVGKSTDTAAKKKHRDPDIAIALFRSLRELTIQEPNLHRVEMEDPKGLEIVLLLGAAAIKDLYFNSNVKETFNIADIQPRKLSAGGRKLSSPVVAAVTPLPTRPQLRYLSMQHTSPPRRPVDARRQWEIDAETARLRAAHGAEERERQRQEAQRRREREAADEAETRRLRRMVEAEQREARRRQEEVDRETERLRREYGMQQLAPPPPQQPPRPHRSSVPQEQPGYAGMTRPQRSQFLQPVPERPHMGSNGLYLQPHASASAVMSGANPAAPDGRKMKNKKSFWGLRSQSDQGERRLSKKASAMW
ncbi:hypothetical protein H2203_003424 [Taxawa tesnikishii (nom. ined.)]|nr:hypothetical protein H2203_003424 [Dothideales sp. JES 119]